jgi:cytoskeletal protein RodZ
MTQKKKIAIIVCAIIVLATAIIVPVTVHKIHKSAVEPSTSGVVENTSENSEVVSLTRRETTTTEQETTEAPSTTEAPVTTAPETTTKKQNQSVTTTKPSTTKTYTTQPAPTQPPAPATTAPQGITNTYGLPDWIVNAARTQNDLDVAKDYYYEDAQFASGQAKSSICERCGKKDGYGSHGTCFKTMQSGGYCPFCHAYVAYGECHSHN